VFAMPISSCRDEAAAAMRSAVSRWDSARAFSSYFRLSFDTPYSEW